MKCKHCSKEIDEEELEAEVHKRIDNLQNPYPKDIFKWDNKEKLNFNRGRFNQHCFEIVENVKTDLKKELNL